jgi:hypothetical protein
MNEAEKLLSQFDRIAGKTYEMAYRITPENERPVIQVLIYGGFPEPDALTGFTLGLSHSHPPSGGHKELMISIRDSDHAWALACGFLAYQLRNQCPFHCGETINFHEKIAASSRMNAFIVTHPTNIAAKDAVIDLGFRQIELFELVPLYEQERSWIVGGGNPSNLLQSRPKRDFLNPKRAPFVRPTA